MRTVVGLDFGTTNSALAVAMPDGSAVLTTFRGHDYLTTTFRSILYFNPENRGPEGKPRAVAGPAALESYLTAETTGRLIQSMKSHLSSRLFQQTNVFGRMYTLEELIALIIRELRATAEAQFGDLGTRVVVGRPVHFSGARSGDEDAFALKRLRAALEQGGFEHIVFEYEPVAAAYDYESRLDHDELILIADFGGGTSDFSLMQVGPTVRRRGHAASDILGTEGVPIAGDAFDSKIVRSLIAPRLGRGSYYRSPFNKVLQGAASSLLALYESGAVASPVVPQVEKDHADPRGTPIAGPRARQNRRLDPPDRPGLGLLPLSGGRAHQDRALGERREPVGVS